MEQLAGLRDKYTSNLRQSVIPFWTKHSPDLEFGGYFIFNTCLHAIRTLPTIPRSEKDPEDSDTNAEDHIYDCIRYQLFTKNYKYIPMDVVGV